MFYESYKNNIILYFCTVAKMQIFIYLICCCLVGRLKSFDIENEPISVYIEGTQVMLTVPNDPQVVLFFLSTEPSDACSTGYTFMDNINETDSLIFRQDLKRELKDKDKIRVYGVFEKKEKVIRKTYEYEIDAQGNGVKQDIPDVIPPECKCTQSITMKSHSLQPCSGTRIFNENFADLSNFSKELRSKVLVSQVDREFVAFVDDRENCYLKDQRLHLTATWVYNKISKFKLDKCTNKRPEYHRIECGPYSSLGSNTLPPIYSSKLHTKDKFSFKYGRVEVRAKMPLGDWLFPYIILQPRNTESESSLVNHLRIAYSRGNVLLQDKRSMSIGANMLFGSAVLWEDHLNYTEYMNMKTHHQGRHYADEFHNYTMIWRKDRIIFKVDGYTYGIITSQRILEEFSKEECFIVLGLSAGGYINFPDDNILIKYFNNSDIHGVDTFSENLEYSTWTQPSLIIEHIHVYTTHENEE